MFVEYYSGIVGGVCNNENDLIESKWECSKALSELHFEKLPHEIYGDFYTNDNHIDIPAGCSIRDGGDKLPHLVLNFKHIASPVGYGRKDLIPICQKNSDPGTTFIFICFKKRIHKIV